MAFIGYEILLFRTDMLISGGSIMDNYTLITGSTSGIGKALAEKFAQQKHNLVLVSKVSDIEVLNHQADLLAGQYDIKVAVIGADLEKEGAVTMIYETVKQLGISIQYLINNAGFGVYGSFLKTDLKKEIDMICVHTICSTKMMKLFLPDMVQNGYGRVLNLSSTASYMSVPNMAVYAATKAYVSSLSKTINVELKGTGVSITALCPGATCSAFAYKAGMEHTLLYRLFVMNPKAVADIGYKALMHGKPYIVAGLYNKVLVLFSKLFPAFIVNPITKRMLR